MVNQLNIIVPNRSIYNKKIKIGTVLRNKESKKEFVVIAKKIHEDKNGRLILSVAMLDEIECESCMAKTAAKSFPPKWFPKNIRVLRLARDVDGIDRPDHKKGYAFNTIKCPICMEWASLDENWKLYFEDNKEK
jgi:hypothetical protein